MSTALNDVARKPFLLCNAVTFYSDFGAVPHKCLTDLLFTSETSVMEKDMHMSLLKVYLL